jgi:hypothetical protein
MHPHGQRRRDRPYGRVNVGTKVVVLPVAERQAAASTGFNPFH